MAMRYTLVLPCGVPGFPDGFFSMLLPVEDVISLHAVYPLKTQAVGEGGRVGKI